DAHGHRFEGGGAYARCHHVIDQLHGVAVANGAAVENVRTNAREYRLHLGIDLGGCADHDGDCGPPLTGASIKVMPAVARSLAMARVALGSPVVMSAMMLPFFRPAARPSPAKMASCTSLEVGRQVITRSLSAASALGLWLAMPPSAARPAILSGRRS